jgi:hypothetical protein
MPKPKRKTWNYENIQEYRKWFEGQTKTTQNRNARKLKQFCDWISKTPEQILKEYETAQNKKAWQRERKKEIEGFYNFLKQSGYKINYCRTQPLGILKFHTRNTETIKEGTKCFDPPQLPENEYIFTQPDLRKAFYYSDLENQTLLSLAVALGYSSADFLELECEKLRLLVKEAKDKGLDFIQFIGKSRAKTSIQPRSHLTPEAIHCLNDYLPILEKKFKGLPKYLWCNDKGTGHITNEGLNKKLKRILKKANIETYGKQVKFHEIRKFMYSLLQAKNRDIAKVITAKKVSASDLTYIPNLDAECLRIFKESYKEFALNGDVTGKNKKERNERIQQLERENAELKLVMRGMAEVFGQEILKKAREQAQKEAKTREEYEKREAKAKEYFDKREDIGIVSGLPEPLTPYEALLFLGKSKKGDKK